MYVVLQVFVLIGTGLLVLERQWPVVQSSFIMAESLVMLMKTHSYFVTNRRLHFEFIRANVQTSSRNELRTDESDTSPSAVSSCAGAVTYPQNVTFGNFFYFLLAPTLVYEISYPRTQRVRITYVLEKIAAFSGVWAVLHVLVHSYVVPVLEQTPQMSPVAAISRLLIPAFACYILIFYIVFDIACNGFAELTRFADREFYQDWWNSTTWDEFARKWNRPVHEWLLRHVYLESINTYQASEMKAAFYTFLLSSVVHELFMAASLRLLRPWLFCLQMLQFPLILLGRHFKGRRIGNIIFWIGLLLGPPMLSILYCRELFISTHHLPAMM